jgi:hypothetical protein
MAAGPPAASTMGEPAAEPGVGAEAKVIIDIVGPSYAGLAPLDTGHGRAVDQTKVRSISRPGPVPRERPRPEAVHNGRIPRHRRPDPKPDRPNQDSQENAMSRFTSLNPSRLIASGGLACALTLGALVIPAATFASGGGSVVRATGSCTVHSSAKLKAKHDNGRIEVEFEVDQNRNGRTWNLRISDDGHRVFTGARKTVAPSGSFSLTVRIPNRAGVDTIVARAVNATTGEVCQARLNV